MQSHHDQEMPNPVGDEAAEQTVDLADIARKLERYRWDSVSLGTAGLALAAMCLGIASVLSHVAESSVSLIFMVALLFVIIAIKSKQAASEILLPWDRPPRLLWPCRRRHI
jgi:hypothetical protein